MPQPGHDAALHIRQHYNLELETGNPNPRIDSSWSLSPATLSELAKLGLNIVPEGNDRMIIPDSRMHLQTNGVQDG